MPSAGVRRADHRWARAGWRVIGRWLLSGGVFGGLVGVGSSPDPLQAQTVAPLDSTAPQPAPQPAPLPAPLPMPPAEPAVRAGDFARLFVRQFALTGNTRWSSDELRREVLARYEGRPLSAEDLEAARQELTRWYVRHGYVNSGARIPDQPIRGGVVTIEIVEGHLTRVDVSGNRYLDERYLIGRVLPAAGPPLDVGVLADRLRQLQQFPVIERLRATLAPGHAPGESVLTVAVEEAPRWQGGLTVANDRSPSTGAVRAQLSGVARSVAGRGDPLALRVGLSRRLDDIGADYAVPLTANDLTLNLRADSSDSLVVEAPFSMLDIRSRTRTGSIGLTWPFGTSADRGHSLGITIEHKRNQTWLLGEPFSFSPGVENGRSAVSVVRLSHKMFRRGVTQALAVRSSLNFGMAAFGATTHSAQPDGRFVSLHNQLQWLRRFDAADGQLYVRSDLQWSSDALLPLEKIAVGGVATVRGYRESALVRDQALIQSIEWRQSLDRWLRRSADSSFIGEWQIAPFLDLALTRNHGATTPSPRSLASAGIALRWSLPSRAFVEVAYGHGFRRLPARGHDLQDRGFHLRITVQTR